MVLYDINRAKISSRKKYMAMCILDSSVIWIRENSCIAKDPKIGRPRLLIRLGTYISGQAESIPWPRQAVPRTDDDCMGYTHLIVSWFGLKPVKSKRLRSMPLNRSRCLYQQNQDQQHTS